MKITYLKIENFKNLKHVEMDNIPNLVILAGPNGVGKSSVFEAIGFAKETLQPYVGEARFNFSNSKFVRRIADNIISVDANFVSIEMKIALASDEMEYVQKHVKNSDHGDVSKNIKKDNDDKTLSQKLMNPFANHNQGKGENDSDRERASNVVTNEFSLKIKMNRSGESYVYDCPEELRVLFKLHDRNKFGNIGVIEYIDAHRVFTPTIASLEGLEISFDPNAEKEKPFAPGDTKFRKVKSSIAKLMMLDYAIVEKELKKGNGLHPNFVRPNISKLKNLFKLIPPKELEEVDINAIPPKYNIKTPLGIIDLDHLSSGEKEILFVYTELLRLGLNNSIILFDEPDLHLNEKIQNKVPSILANLGTNNQIWIGTHSTAIINSSDSDNIFRLSNFSDKNQMSKIGVEKDRMDLIYELVGNNTLTKGEKIVFVEGIEKTDKYILEKWFDDPQDNLVFVSSDSINQINRINEASLSLMNKRPRYNYFYCIRDRDFMSNEEYDRYTKSGKNIFVWKRYHIENYLLHAQALFNVSRLLPNSPFRSPDDCINMIKGLVTRNKDTFVNKLMQLDLYSVLNVSKARIKISDDDKINQINIQTYQSQVKDLASTEIDLPSMMAQITSRQNNTNVFSK
jgi:AAA15 family ATPase/GTPase